MSQRLSYSSLGSERAIAMAAPAVANAPAAAAAPAADKAVAHANGEKAGKEKRAFAEVPKAEKPNKDEHEARIRQLQTSEGVMKTRLDSIQREFDARKAARDAHTAQKREVTTKLRAIQKQKDALYKERTALTEQIKQSDEQRKQKRAELENMKKNLKYSTEQEIDDAIAKIEYRLSTTSLSLKAEKDLVNEIKQLKASKAAVKAYEESKNEDRVVDTKALRAQRDLKDKELDSLRSAEEELRAAFSAVKEREGAANSALDALVTERKKVQQDYNTVREDLNRARREYEKQTLAYDRYIKYLQYVKRNEQRRLRKEREDAERKQREEDGAKEAEQVKEEEKRHPYEAELFLCDELARYLKRLMPYEEESKGDEAGAESAAASSKPLVDKDGKPLVTANQGTKKSTAVFVAPDGTVAGAGAQPKKKSRRRQQKAQNVPLAHIPDIFSQFERLGLVPPIDTDSVASSLKQLADKAEYFRTAPPPISAKEREEIARREKKQKQELAMLKEQRLKEAQERAKAAETVNEAVKAERARREQEVKSAQDENVREREKAIQESDRAMERERESRLAEAAAADKESKDARRSAARLADEAAEAERKRREQEEAEADRAAEEERKKRRRGSIVAEEEEQKRRIAELARQQKEQEDVDARERAAAARRADDLAEQERQRRVREEGLKEEDHKAAGQAAIKLEEAERQRRVEERKREEQNVAEAERSERVRRRSLALELEEAERARRIAEAAQAQSDVARQSQADRDRADAAVEAERKRQIREFPERIQKSSIFMKVEKPDVVP